MWLFDSLNPIYWFSSLLDFHLESADVFLHCSLFFCVESTDPSAGGNWPMGQLKLMRKEKQEMPQETKNVQRTLESNETLENVVEKGDKLENYNIRQIHNYTPVVSS